MMRVLDLFSGIGGFSLGLERAGMQTVAFCEIEPYCRAVLAKHWPGVPCYDDIRELSATRLADDGIAVDVICGGFPCQDISFAGKGAGLAGARSGLWSEYARLIRELSPRYVIVENVAALLGRGLAEILGTLAEIGYDAEWHCIPASYVGAPHRRDRLWIVAYPTSMRCENVGTAAGLSTQDAAFKRESVGAVEPAHVADAAQSGCETRSGDGMGTEHGTRGHEGQLASACGEAGNGPDSGEPGERIRRRIARTRENAQDDADASRGLFKGSVERRARGRRESTDRDWWLVEPDVGRVAHGIPHRVHRLKALGNAVVPQIPEMIGRAIVEDVCRNPQ